MCVQYKFINLELVFVTILSLKQTGRRGMYVRVKVHNNFMVNDIADELARNAVQRYCLC